jgi:chemotaxis protein CheD
MGDNGEKSKHYLYPGLIFAHREAHVVSTVLGSCVSVCLFDEPRQIGGMNHFMLPFWNSEGLPTPKYGSVAIPRLIEKMIQIGSSRSNLKAKVFGGGRVIKMTSDLLNIGDRNIQVAFDLLEKEGIPVLKHDVGNTCGRKLMFETDTGAVFLKRLKGSTMPD